MEFMILLLSFALLAITSQYFGQASRPGVEETRPNW